MGALFLHYTVTLYTSALNSLLEVHEHWFIRVVVAHTNVVHTEVAHTNVAHTEVAHLPYDICEVADVYAPQDVETQQIPG